MTNLQMKRNELADNLRTLQAKIEEMSRQAKALEDKIDEADIIIDTEMLSLMGVK